MIQTYRPSNYAIKYAAERKVGEFYKAEIENRKMMGFPPFTRVIRVVFRAKEREKASRSADDFSQLLLFYLKSLRERAAGAGNPPLPDVRILGPAECPVSLLAGNYRYHILVLSPDFHYARSSVLFSTERIKLGGGVYMEIDVDPVSLM